MNYNIPLFNLSYNNLKIKDHILSVVERHIKTSTFILGPDVKLFEEKIPWYDFKYTGCSLMTCNQDIETLSGVELESNNTSSHALQSNLYCFELMLVTDKD